MITRRARIGLAAGLLGLACVACSSDDTTGPGTSAPDPGPMRFGNGWVSGCAPASQYHRMVFEQFLSVPGKDAVIDAVDTVHTAHMDVRRYLVLVDPKGGQSVGYTAYPPKVPTWKDAVPAVGAHLPAGANVFLIADLEPTEPAGGSMSGTTIRYSIGDREYEATTENSFEIGTCDDE